LRNAILDTNVFLHWDIKSVDWCKELNADQVKIIVVVTVLKELDEKKRDKNRTLAERARRNLTLIESLNASGNELRKGVKLSIIAAEPKIDWEQENLDHSMRDDRIIAKMLERKNKDDVLVTDDSTPRIKAQIRKLPTAQLGAEKLEEPKDELEKELEKANRELLTYKSRSPDLTLHLESKGEGDIPQFEVHSPSPMNDSEIEKLVEVRRAELDVDFTPRDNFNLFPLAFTIFGTIDIPAYRQEVGAHLKGYRNYLKEKNRHDLDMAGMIEMQFILENHGRVPAEGVYCEINFPEGFEIFKKDTLPEAPSEPAKPVPVTSFQRMMSPMSSLGANSLLATPFIPYHSIPAPRPRIEIDSTTIEMHVPDIRHGFSYGPDAFLIRIPSPQEPENFEIQYEIHARNLPAPVQRRIPVRLNRRGAR
jgi:rRNA-processing protein FCF1